MPPKTQSVLVTDTKNISLSLTVIKKFPADGSIPAASSPRGPAPSGFRCRIFSSWAENCLTTPIIGGESLPWVVDEEKRQYSSLIQYKFSADLNDTEQFKTFHKNPGIYFFFQSLIDTNMIKPLDLLHVDCSLFLLKETTISLKRVVGKDYEVRIAVESSKIIKPMSELLPYEPIALSIKFLNNYPRYDKEERRKSLENVYIYSSLKITATEFRPFFGLPSIGLSEEEMLSSSTTTSPRQANLNDTLPTAANEITFDKTLSSTMGQEIPDQDKFPLKLKAVLLPGLYDLNYYHEVLASHTFSIQVHQEDLLSRCFSPSNMEAYIKLVTDEPGGLGLPSAAQPVLTKKGSATGPAATAGGLFTPTPVKLLQSDNFLLNAILSALEQSKMIRNHGCARFRMEQLLSKSNDLLLKFSKKRDPSLADKDQISIKESMIAAVRLEKPSHPEKWDLPADMSLKRALAEAKQRDEQIKEAASSPQAKRQLRPAKLPPRYELFIANNTNLSVKAKLMRKLDPFVSSYDSALPMVHAKTLQDPKMTIQPGADFSKTVRVNNDNLQNLSEDQVTSILSYMPFTRIIIRFPYQDDDTLRALNEGIIKINHQALPNIQGTIRSYSLEPKEREAAIKGELDILSGFMILDDDQRLVVLEGLAKPFGGIHRFYSDYLPKQQNNTEQYSILCNPTILFPDRLYPDYSPDIKRIRIRGKLSKLSKKPEIYNHKQVEEICFQAIDLLMNLTRLQDLKTSKLFTTYPLMDSLNKLELLYGEAITRSDMDGTLKKEFLESFKRKRRSRGSSHQSSRPGTSDSRPGTSGSRATTPGSRSSRASSPLSGRSQSPSAGGLTGLELGEESEEEQKRTTYQRREKKLPNTDCWNKEFENLLATRPKHRINYLEEQKKQRQEAYLNMLFRRDQKQQLYRESLKKAFKLTDADIDAGKVPNIYTYSNQSENYKSKIMQSLREEMKQNPTTIYTMSTDFVSQTICIIDEDKYQKQQVLAMTNPSAISSSDKSEWLTAKGFQYPKPKTIKELYEHPKRPTETRVEDLKEPFQDQTDIKKKPSIDSLDHEIFQQRERNFHTQFHLEGTFGGLELPQYEKEFELKYIGHPKTLPRGKQLNDGEKNTNFFKSVFLGGEKQQQLIRQAMEEEKRQWESKVVVENKSFQVGHFVIHDKPLPFARTENILHDPPKKGVLKDLYAKKGFENTPLTIFATEPYAGKNASNTIGRDEDPEKFITAIYPPKEAEFTILTSHSPKSKGAGRTSGTNKPQDFIRYLNSDTIKGDLYTKIAKRKHPVLDKTNSKECSGPKWEPPQL